MRDGSEPAINGSLGFGVRARSPSIQLPRLQIRLWTIA